MYYDVILNNGKNLNSNIITVGILGEKLYMIEGESIDFNKISKNVIDLQGSFILPGFIDVHSHTDEACLNKSLNSKIIQGITTEVCGNCGGSAAPMLTEQSYIIRKKLKKLEDQWYTSYRWKNFNEYFNIVKNSSCLCNQLSFVGLWTIYDSTQDFNEIYQIAKECLKMGCVGISINQNSASWKSLDNQQKIKLFQLVYRQNKVISIHLSNYSDNFIEAIDEIGTIIKKCPVKIIFSHMKFLGNNRQKNIEFFNNLLVEYNKFSNMRFDIYPYSNICTRLKNIVEENGYKIKDFYKINILEYGISIEINNGRITKQDLDLLLDLYMNNKELLVEAYGMEQKDIEYLIENDNCFIGTDFTSCKINTFEKKKNPQRAFNSFPTAFEILRRNRKELSTIIYKFSVYPSKFFEIDKRGTICNGNFADIVACDIVGKDIDIKHVFVNGKLKVSKN